MNKVFIIAFAMWLVSTLLIGMLSNNAVTGAGWGFMLSIATFVFFEYVYYDDEKKTEKGEV